MQVEDEDKMREKQMQTQEGLDRAVLCARVLLQKESTESDKWNSDERRHLFGRQNGLNVTLQEAHVASVHHMIHIYPDL